MSGGKGVITVIAAVVLGLLSTTASAQFAERKIKISTGLAEDNPVGVGIKKMQEVLTAKSGGKMKIRASGAAALGPDTQMQQALIGGAQEMMVGSTATLVGLSPEMAVWDTPFLFSNAKEADVVLDGPVGEKVKATLEPKGMVGLVYWENGFRNLTNSKRLIKSVDDIAGLKVRVVQSPTYLDTWTALGANAVPMPITEVYTAMEQKMIDGHENPFTVIEANKFYEVQKYLSFTKHSYTPTLVMVSKKLWDTLSPVEQKTLKECAVEGRDVQRKANADAETKSVEMMKKKGIAVNDVSPAELQRIRDKTKPISDAYAAKLNPEAVSMVFNELKVIRGGK